MKYFLLATLLITSSALYADGVGNSTVVPSTMSGTQMPNGDSSAGAGDTQDIAGEAASSSASSMRSSTNQPASMDDMPVKKDSPRIHPNKNLKKR